MPNKQNLRVPTSSEARENGKKGGIASGEARRAKKSLREAMQILMDADLTGKDGKTMTGTEAMAAKAFQAALKGDWKAWELVRDTSGQKPVDKVQSTQTVVDMSAFSTEEIKAMLDEEV